MDFKTFILKYMKQIYQIKEKSWNSILYKEFLKEFLSFQTSNDNHDDIPFRLVFKLHHANILIPHYLRQLFVIIHILGTVFGIHLSSLSLDNLVIRKTDFHKTFLFVFNQDIQTMMTCTHGYHIHIIGFQYSHLENIHYPWIIDKLPSIFPYKRFCKEMIREVKDEMGDKLPKFYNRMMGYRRQKMPWIELGDEEIGIFDLLPLITINSHHECFQNIKTVQKEVKKMYTIFKKEALILKSKFTRPQLFQQLIKDWVELLVMYKKDFFENPDITISILRKVLYQYMIDHRYNHISFKTFDLSRMLVSLYLWSEWYEKYLQKTLSIVKFNYCEESLWIGCIETCIEKDEFQGIHNKIHVYKFETMEDEMIPIDMLTNDRLCKTHPIQRPKYLYDTIQLYKNHKNHEIKE